MVGLTTFEAPLLRLILCGGGGVPGAWGPLLHGGSGVLGCGDPNWGHWVWDPAMGAAVRPNRAHTQVVDYAERWSLSLDPASPWPARLALVAAWLASAWMPSGAVAEVAICERWLHIYTYSGGASDVRSWACDDGGNIEPGAVRLDLPTLPTHLAAHPPVVALLLALYDVPEIRARVEAP